MLHVCIKVCGVTPQVVYRQTTLQLMTDFIEPSGFSATVICEKSLVGLTAMKNNEIIVDNYLS